MTPKDEVPPPTYTTPGAAENGLMIDARFLNCGGDLMAMVMPAEGWGALLDVLRDASAREGADPDLATFYAGMKHGLGFKLPSEILQPERPELES